MPRASSCPVWTLPPWRRCLPSSRVGWRERFRWEARGSLHAVPVPGGPHPAGPPGGLSRPNSRRLEPPPPLRLSGRGLRPLHPAQWSACRGGVTPQPLRPLHGPCTGRTSDTHGGEVSARGSWGTPKDRMLSGHRARDGHSAAYGSVYVWDLAYLYLNRFRPATALCQGVSIFRVPDCGARPSDQPLLVYNRTPSRSDSCRNWGRSLYRFRGTPVASATPTGLAPGECPPVPSHLRKIQFPLRPRRS